MNSFYRVMVIGASWHGSDCTGLARGFRELGHVVELIGSDQFFPITDQTISARLLRRVISPFCERQFNSHILRQMSIIQPDLVVVFKGNHVQPSTLKAIRGTGVWLCNYFPDISFFAHRTVTQETWPQYNHIFSTKVHGAEEMKQHLGLENVSFLQNGFDDDVHRPVSNRINVSEDMQCNVSFIGGWSPGKERHLKGLVNGFSDIDLHIWGSRWSSCQSVLLKPFIKGSPVLGDFYALAIGCSKINLGLLQDQQGLAPVGDSVTSRTFHIPASGGFLLHERTEEVPGYFEEGKEIACFDSSAELVEKVRYFLANEQERQQIAKAGYERCVRENSLTIRARVIIEEYESELNQGFKAQ